MYKRQAPDPYPALAAQVLRLIGEFDGSRMDYGEDDAQAVENIARQLHDPVQREELYELLRSFLDHADPEEEIAVDVALCLEQIEALPPALTPEQALREEIKTYLDEAGYAASDELIEDGISEYRSHGGKGNSQVVAGFIERELLAEEPAAEAMPSGHGDEYRLLGRLKADCDYFLGTGGRAEKHLWAGNVREQIAKMRELYAALPEKPDVYKRQGRNCLEPAPLPGQVPGEGNPVPSRHGGYRRERHQRGAGVRRPGGGSHRNLCQLLQPAPESPCDA